MTLQNNKTKQSLAVHSILVLFQLQGSINPHPPFVSLLPVSISQECCETQTVPLALCVTSRPHSSLYTLLYLLPAQGLRVDNTSVPFLLSGSSSSSVDSLQVQHLLLQFMVLSSDSIKISFAPSSLIDDESNITFKNTTYLSSYKVDIKVASFLAFIQIEFSRGRTKQMIQMSRYKAKS